MKKKAEALSVNRLINEVLVNQLCIPLKQVVNDTTFSSFTGNKRPDILISEFEYDGENDNQFIDNLVAYAEAKDIGCTVDDKDWKDATKQAKEKSKKLRMPYYIVTNCKTSIFYNAYSDNEIKLNGNPIREFQTIDILRLIKNRLLKDKTITNIQTSVDSISTISESIFNKKLWELASTYRNISFKNNNQKIDFTIGFIALEFFEEKSMLDSSLDKNKIYWSDCDDRLDEKLVANLQQYIRRLETETGFSEFRNLMEIVLSALTQNDSGKILVSAQNVRLIYNTINSMKPLHGTGFDLFGAVYESFASTKEKKEFGEYFTRRHYAHIFSKLLFRNEEFFNKDRTFKIIDPACGTGGFLTESFKVLQNKYIFSDTLSKEASQFLSKDCFYGIDVREENIARAKLNMFLVGDGHTHIRHANSLIDDIGMNMYDYVITNPPYGNGTIKADTSSIGTSRLEIAFLMKIIKLLKVGGKACMIIPDGVLENPSYREIRKELLEKCSIEAIVSLPKFAFAPYTKEKTYALFFTKRSNKNTKIQTSNIWFYIIDNDGLANSDKRFQTRLRNNRNGWQHDEISGWVSTDGDEKAGLLEARWLTFDDKSTGGTEWKNEKGELVKFRKAGFVNIDTIINDNYITLLPEYYLRPYEPNYIDLKSLKKEVKDIEKLLSEML